METKKIVNHVEILADKAIDIFKIIASNDSALIKEQRLTKVQKDCTAIIDKIGKVMFLKEVVAAAFAAMSHSYGAIGILGKIGITIMHGFIMGLIAMFMKGLLVASVLLTVIAIFARKPYTQQTIVTV